MRLDMIQSVIDSRQSVCLAMASRRASRYTRLCRQFIDEHVHADRAFGYNQLIELMTKSLAPIDYQSSLQRSSYQLLFAGKSVANEEAKIVAQASSDIDFFQYSRQLQTRLARKFIGDFNHYNHFHHDESAEGQLIDCLESIFATWQKAGRAHGFWGTNIHHVDERIFSLAARRLKIPFLFMHKECTLTDALSKHIFYLNKTKRKPCAARHVFVYNNFIKKLFIETEICDEDRISVTGMPRLDMLHEWRKSRCGNLEEPKHVVYFFPGLYTQVLPEMGAEYEFNGWHEVITKTSQAIFKLATQFPKIKFTVKPKPRDYEKAHLVFERFGSKPKNLQIGYRVSAGELVKQSNIACCFNSSTILECLAAGTPVVCPSFGEAAEEKYQPLILDFGKSFLAAESPDHLISIIKQAIHGKITPQQTLSEEAKEMLDYWACNVDGGVSRALGLRFHEQLAGN